MELSRDKQELSQALREIEIYGTAPEFDETGFPIIRERDVPFSTGGRVGKQEGGLGEASLFWATGGRQFEEDFDPDKPMEAVSIAGPRSKYGFTNKRPVNTAGRADAGIMVRPTIFDAYQDKDDPELKIITTGKVKTTVPVGLSHMEHAYAHVHNIFETYTLGKALDLIEKIQKERGKHWSQRTKKQEGGELDAQMTDMMEEPTHTMPDGTEMPGATHEEYIEEAQLPDYVEFIIAEALEPEEQQYLTDRLVEDDQLSMIFDKVVETAAEFSGSGSVDGPGTGISDSIPARLSDGEFVMTAKATDAIGADTLQELMSLAEQEAETGRQAKAIGGEAQSEVEKISSTVIEEDQISLKNKEAMRSLDPRLSLFAS